MTTRMVNGTCFFMIRNIIDELNDLMYSHIMENEALPSILIRPFIIESDGKTVYVRFFNIVVWDSNESDTRDPQKIKTEIIKEARQIQDSIHFSKINDD